MTIAALIDKEDNVEIVRDQILAILIAERDAQMVLAAGAAKDPELWNFRAFKERANHWDFFQNDDDVLPVVNVWFDSESFDGGSSNISERQTADGRFNIDIYARGISHDDLAGGHFPGDLDAANNLHRTIRLVRNILMAAQYSYLDLRGTVGKRWPDSIGTFQPQQDNNQAQQIVAARFVLGVHFNEFSPQVEGEALEQLTATLTLSPSGEVITATPISP